MNIKIRLDQSVQLKDGSHPVVLLITWGNNVRRKRLKGMSCKRQSWDFEEHCFMRSHKKNAIIEQQEKKAWRIFDYMEEWDYKEFTRQFDQTNKEKTEERPTKKLIQYAKELEEYYINNNQVGYSRDFKSVASFLEKCFSKDIWLQNFGERELHIVLKKLDELEIQGYGYMRGIKIILSLAIQKGYLKPDNCPIKTKFSPTGYDINKRKRKPSKKIKKNRIKDMSEEEKEMVVDYYHNADIPQMQKKHLAYWVLSYKLFGVNFKDLALMKWEDVSNNYWKYNRAKTGIGSATGKPIPKEAMAILKEYDTGGKYILDALNGYDESPERIQTRLRNYKANMRRSFKILSKRIGFSDNRYITWYSGRYTSITLAIQKNVDLNTVRTLADHASIKTTSKYVGIVRDREKLKEAMDLL